MSGEMQNHDSSIGRHLEEVRGVIGEFDEKTPDMSREYEEAEIAMAGIQARYGELVDDVASLLVTLRGLEAASMQHLKANDEMVGKLGGLLAGTSRAAGRRILEKLAKLPQTTSVGGSGTRNNIGDAVRHLDILKRRLDPERKRVGTISWRTGLMVSFGRRDVESKASLMRDVDDYLQP